MNKKIMPITMKEEQCAGCAYREVCGQAGITCDITWDVGVVDAYIEYLPNALPNFTCKATVNGKDYLGRGAVADEAAAALADWLRRAGYTGKINKRYSKQAKEMKDEYYYRTSGIPGDTYGLLITPRSSLRDRCRSLCD